MKTRVASDTKEVIVDTDGPLVIIGEKINPTGRKRLSRLLAERRFEAIQEEAVRQVAAGADILDINVGVPGVDEVTLLPAVITVVDSVVDVPLCLDSANPRALAAGLEAVPGKPVVNSVNGDETSLNAILPLVRDRQAVVIGLTMDERGIPDNPQDRVAIAGRILERAASLGIPAEDVMIDPLVLTVGADHNAAMGTLETIRLVRQEFGVNINLGASNVSFGLPDRHLINQAFLALAAMAGASCVITDPLKQTGIIRAIDLLLGRDAYGRRYIQHYRGMLKRSR